MRLKCKLYWKHILIANIVLFSRSPHVLILQASANGILLGAMQASQTDDVLPEEEIFFIKVSLHNFVV